MNAVRLAIGTLTIFPTEPPSTVDRRVAGTAMTLAPLVGGFLVVPLAAITSLVEDQWSTGLQALLWIAGLAVLTRAMHLDGLADTADGLGSGKPASEALEIMRKSDVGPFGVATLVLVLLTQVLAAAQLLIGPDGIALVATAVVYSRVMIPLACRYPAARDSGLGATVGGSVSTAQAVVACLLGALLVAVVAVIGTQTEAVLTGLAGLLVGSAFCALCVRRFGGITGDVVGACVEVALTVSLLAMTLVSG